MPKEITLTPRGPNRPDLYEIVEVKGQPPVQPGDFCLQVGTSFGFGAIPELVRLGWTVKLVPTQLPESTRLLNLSKSIDSDFAAGRLLTTADVFGG